MSGWKNAVAGTALLMALGALGTMSPVAANDRGYCQVKPPLAA
jgi:hypothetical protein